MKLDTAQLKDMTVEAPTTILGDWYTNYLLIQRQHLVILVSEPSRLCVLTPAKDISKLPDRLISSLQELLIAYDLPNEIIEKEIEEMNYLSFGTTASTDRGRSVLGSIKQYAQMLQYGYILDRSIFWSGTCPLMMSPVALSITRIHNLSQDACC